MLALSPVEVVPTEPLVELLVEPLVVELLALDPPEPPCVVLVEPLSVEEV